MFERRTENAIARVQFALADVNAHIDHDLPRALVKTAMLTGEILKQGRLRDALDTYYASPVAASSSLSTSCM